MKSISLPAFLLAIVLLTSPGRSADSLPLVLLTSETVTACPRLQFVDSAGAVHEIPLSGTAPGRIFNGSLAFSDNIAPGSGEFRIVPGTMVDKAGISGTEITAGRYYTIPNRVNAILIQNRYYDFTTGKLRTP